jgi:hypothetical protein
MTGFNPSWITHYRGKLSALWKGRYALGRTADPDRYFVLSEAISGLFDELLTAKAAALVRKVSATGATRLQTPSRISLFAAE